MNYSWDHSPGEVYPWHLLKAPGEELNLFGLIPPDMIRRSLRDWINEHPGMVVELIREQPRQYIARRTA